MFSDWKTVREEMMWATISSELNDVIRSESAKMDYIWRSNIIKMSGERKIVTEFEVELPTYPLWNQV